jgi:tetratricopeptide (TPR) repeat protein
MKTIIVIMFIFLTFFCCSINSSHKLTIEDILFAEIDNEILQSRINDLNALLEKKKQNTGNLLEIGFINYRLKNIEDAQTNFINVIRQDSTNSEAFEGLSLTYLEKDELDSSKFNLNRALQIDPSSPIGYFCKATYLFTLEMYRDAITDLDYVIKCLNNYSKLYIIRALAYSELNSVNNMNNDFEKAFQISQQNPDILFIKAFSNDDKGNLYTALQDYNRLIQIDKIDKIRGYLGRAEIYVKLDSNELAINDYKKVLRFDTSKTSLKFHISGLYAKMGQYDSTFFYIVDVIKRDTEGYYIKKIYNDEAFKGFCKNKNYKGKLEAIIKK